MIEILGQFLNLFAEVINWFFSLEIEFTDNVRLSVGVIFVSIVALIGIIYLVSWALGFVGKEGE